MTLHEQFVDLWDRQSSRRSAPAQATAQPAPWQGISEIAQSLGINLGELWRTREEELKAARGAADATSKELHELRLREIDSRVQQLQAMADKMAQTQTTPPGQKSFLEKLEEITQGMISQRFARMIDGDRGQSQTPADPVDEFFKRLDQVDKIKERFAGSGGSNVQALAQSGIRGELLKLLLEDERDRLKMQYDHESQVEKNKHLGTLASTVKENLGDGIRALQAAAAEFKTGTAATTKEAPQTHDCEACKTRFTIPATEDWEAIKCPNPNCGKTWTRKELLGS